MRTSLTELLARAKAIRDRVVHSNDLLIASSANDSDYILTYDADLQSKLVTGNAIAVTPEQFLHELESQP